MPHREIEINKIDARVIREIEDFTITKNHYMVLGKVLAATMPKQPFAIQDCLTKALEDNKIFFPFKVFNTILRNIGVVLSYDEEKLIKELFLSKKLMRLSRMGDVTADVVNYY